MLNANFMNENNTNSCKYMYITCIFWKILNLKYTAKLNMKKKLQISYRYNGKCVVPNFVVIYYIFYIYITLSWITLNVELRYEIHNCLGSNSNVISWIVFGKYRISILVGSRSRYISRFDFLNLWLHMQFSLK